MEGAAQLVSTLGQLVGDEYRQLSGVSGQVAMLRDELATMNSILRMQSEIDDGTVDHFVREWMKQVREVANAAEDCVDIYIFRVRCRLGDLGFLFWSKHLLPTLFARRRLAGEIRALHARAVAIGERHARYSVGREALTSREAFGSTPLYLMPVVPAVNRRLANHEFIGDQADFLARQVMAKEHRGDEMKLKVFSILGIGGLGKTTLATEVCRLLETEFSVQARVSVSRTFNARKDLKELLKCLLQQIVNVKGNFGKGIEEVHSVSVGEINMMTVEDMALRIKEILKDKRYLIVIDDSWTTTAWDAIQPELPENNCGSRVLVTTQIIKVAQSCSDGSASRNNIYNISPLSVDDSKKLFLSGVFGSMDASCPKELEDEMEKILSKCDGLPLYITNIASFLAGYAYTSLGSKDMWVKVRRSLESQMESTPTLEGMKQTVTLAYNHLPHYLKGCMLYLSIFPEDFIISKVRLLLRWIAEGLVEEKRGWTLLEIAEMYFEELVSMNMIITDENKETVQVHDMILEVIVSKSIETNFVSLVGGLYAGMSYHRVRRLSIHDGGQGRNNSFSKKKRSGRATYRSGIEGMNMNYVRSLSMFDLERHEVLDRLGEFTLLRMLDLEDCKGLENKHMRAICRMYFLRYLGLKGTNISVVPPEVSNLEHLQTLDVYQTRLSGLPKTVTRLENLERLLISNKDPGNWATSWKPPIGLSEMKALQKVRNVVIDNVRVAREIGYLEQLKAIDVYVDGRSEHKDKVRQALACSLCRTNTLRSLTVGDIIDEDNAMDYLIDLSAPPPLLLYLGIAGNISKFPNWVGCLTHLVELAISRTKLAKDELFDILCKAPNLEIVLFDNSFYTGHQLVARAAHKFPVLKVMRVPCYAEYPKVFEFEEGSMRKLETLELNFGGHTEKSIVGIQHLTNLKKVQLSGGRGNPALSRALEEIQAESHRRPKGSQFRVAVKYS